MVVFASIWSYLVDAYREWSASAMAANTFLRCMFAGGFPLFAVQVYSLKTRAYSRCSTDLAMTGQEHCLHLYVWEWHPSHSYSSIGGKHYDERANLQRVDTRSTRDVLIACRVDH
jgi:hypothetical protein